MKKVRMGVIGLGNRGYAIIGTVLSCEEAEVTAVCDVYADRIERAAEKVKKLRGNEVKKYSDYRELLKSDEVDAVLVASGWENHVEASVTAMKCGKAVAMEVGGSYSIEDCYCLVNTYRETGTPFMFMENCCFDKFELLTTSLVRAGKLGEIVHCHGAYAHDLRDEVTGGNVNRHYRLNNYLKRNCENYPTHELGPIAKILNINRGNRMVSLVSVASKSAGLKEYVKNKKPDPSLEGKDFAQGDIVSTVIKCAGGETITLTLDTTLPRYYSREFTVRGTKGLAWQEADMVIIENECDTHAYKENCGSAAKYAEYLPPVWKNITEEQLKLGHGGMDYLEFKAFFKALLNGEEMPIDVYDAAALMCITALSEKSIALGGMPQSIPDFTEGKWILRPSKDVTELS